MLDDFIVRAALAGVGVALCAGALGCFIVWRRMAYFGDAISHGAILGVALALAMDGSIFLGVVAVSIAMGLAMQLLVLRGQGAIDAILGVLSHTALASGLVAVSLIPSIRIDLDAYLFGDLLTVSRGDLAVIWMGALIVLLTLWARWQAALTVTLSKDLAYASGIRPAREEIIMTCLMAIVVAVALKVVGALLITSLMVIPAVAAGRLARGPESMAGLAMGIGVLSVLGGLRISLWTDTPVGPTAVCVAAAIFFIAASYRAVRGRR